MSASGPLPRRAASGLAWVFSSMVAARAITFASTLVLARLLAPEHFGVLAIPLLVLTYLETVGDFGTGAALVRQQRDVEDAAVVTFGFNLVLGAAWSAAMLAAADPIARFFGDPAAVGPLRALAAVPLLKALGNTHDALLVHDLSFRRRALPEIARALVRAAASIALAAAGLDVWALAWGQLAGTLAWVAAQWAAAPWRPWRHLSQAARARAHAAVRPMLGFGSQVVLVNLLGAVLHHVDQLLVGRYSDREALGLYATAAKLPEALITTLTWAVGRVAFPAFARAEGDLEARRGLYLSALRLVALATLPCAALLAGLAGPFVVTAFGEAWRGAGAILPWLALAAAFRATGSHAGDLFKGAGRPDLLRNLALVKVLVAVPLMVAAGALTRSPVAIAAALAAGTLATSSLNVAVAVRVLSLRAGDVARAVVPGAACALAAAAAAIACGALLAGRPEALVLAVAGGLGAATWAAGAWIATPELRALALAVRVRARRAAP